MFHGRCIFGDLNDLRLTGMKHTLASEWWVCNTVLYLDMDGGGG